MSEEPYALDFDQAPIAAAHLLLLKWTGQLLSEQVGINANLRMEIKRRGEIIRYDLLHQIYHSPARMLIPPELIERIEDALQGSIGETKP
jgi:hypothetical protein